MLGLPGDTAISMEKTVNFALKMNPDIANFMITLPIPGTELYKEIEKNGRFIIDTKEGVEEGFYSNRVFYELGPTEPKLVGRYYREAYLRFYLRPSKIFYTFFRLRSKDEFYWILSVTSEILKSMFNQDKR